MKLLASAAATALLLFALGTAIANAQGNQQEALPSTLPVVKQLAERMFPPQVTGCASVTITFSPDGEGVPDGWDAYARVGLCEANFRPYYRGATYFELCPLMLHEYGHLAGLPHSEDPHNVMYSGEVWPSECGPRYDDYLPEIRRYDALWNKLHGRHRLLRRAYTRHCRQLPARRRARCRVDVPAALHRQIRSIELQRQRLRAFLDAHYVLETL